jgi:hypothetical protein
MSGVNHQNVGDAWRIAWRLSRRRLRRISAARHIISAWRASPGNAEVSHQTLPAGREMASGTLLCPRIAPRLRWSVAGGALESQHRCACWRARRKKVFRRRYINQCRRNNIFEEMSAEASCEGVKYRRLYCGSEGGGRRHVETNKAVAYPGRRENENMF